MGTITAADKEALLAELGASFDAMRAKLGFTAALDELDRVFYIRDLVLQQGYVTPNLSRAVCSRIRDTVSSWTGQLHNWVMANPNSMIAMSESGIFSDGDKDAMMALMREQMAFVERNVVAGLTHDAAMERDFIDGALPLWRKHLPIIESYARRVQEYWENESKRPPAKRHLHS